MCFIWRTLSCTHCISNRGDNFRKEFSHLGEVRSILPPTVNILALTATATRTMQKDIQKVLGMPTLVVVTDKPNVLYSVHPYDLLDISFGPVIEELRNARTNLGRTIIYCQKQEDCANLRTYIYFSNCGWETRSVNCKMFPIYLNTVLWTCS